MAIRRQAASAGIGGNGTTFAVDGAGECVVTSGGPVGLSLGNVLGLGEIILRADAITGSCTATDTTHEASATLTNAVVVARLMGIDTVLLILEETPAPGTVLGVPGVLSITLNQQASSGTDHVTATALEVVKVNAALSEVAIGVVECTGGADTTPPVITVSNVFAEATGPAGATAAFTPTANDDVDGTVPVTCVPASGSTFPVGVTTVTCTATDSSGNTGNAGFSVTVQDTTGPLLSVPDEILAAATGPDGGIVTYGAGAIDAVDGPVDVT